jgi:hypothetical protein
MVIVSSVTLAYNECVYAIVYIFSVYPLHILSIFYDIFTFYHELFLPSIRENPACLASIPGGNQGGGEGGIGPKSGHWFCLVGEK